MRVLITGSSGQIGTNLALNLLDQGHFVITITPFSIGTPNRERGACILTRKTLALF